MSIELEVEGPQEYLSTTASPFHMGKSDSWESSIITGWNRIKLELGHSNCKI